MFACSFSPNSVISAVVLVCLVGASSKSICLWWWADAYRFRALILRHGQTCSNAGGIIQGSSDLSRLTDLGREQARDVALAIKKSHDNNANDEFMDFVQVYCSPLTRARQTYQILHENNAISSPKNKNSNNNIKHPIILSDLREIDFYDWQDQPKDILRKEYPNSYKAWKAGEPYGLIVPETTAKTQSIIKHRPLLELWDRADQVWEEILYNHINVNRDNGKVEIVDEQSILIVAHGSLGQALLGTAMGWDATHFRQYEFPNCGLVEIEWREEQNTDTEEKKSTSSSSSKIISSSQHQHHRPKAIRWRWKWPEPSDWKSYSDSILREETSSTF